MPLRQRGSDHVVDGAKPLWIRKAAAPSVQIAQRFEADARTALMRAGASDQTAKALISQAFSIVTYGDVTDLGVALEEVVADAGGALADAWMIDNNRASAVDVLAVQYPEPEVPMGTPTAASPDQEIDRQAAALRGSDPTLSIAKARTRVLKAHPELYSQASSALDDTATVADYVDAALAVELKKRLEAGEPVASASRGLVRDNPSLAALAELCRLHPADAAHGLVEGSHRLRKHRSDAAALIRAVAADADVIMRVGKMRP